MRTLLSPEHEARRGRVGCQATDQQRSVWPDTELAQHCPPRKNTQSNASQDTHQTARPPLRVSPALAVRKRLSSFFRSKQKARSIRPSFTRLSSAFHTTSRRRQLSSRPFVRFSFLHIMTSVDIARPAGGFDFGNVARNTHLASSSHSRLPRATSTGDASPRFRGRL
jgi:hypothetical protein